MTPSEPDKQPRHDAAARRAEEDWSERCARLFGEMRRPARAMVARAYGRALSDDAIDDVYSAAWAATLAALRDRGRHMEERELRAYILTAVASHASKEMRRRSRKPVHPLEAEREQVATDGHAPLPDEIAIGSESRGVARDLLMSLPVRRRAVMLLRYGWGLSPTEVCALVPGLSPRAYRKEITRGVEDLIEGLGRVEDGQWCESRRGLIRDLVAGTADEPSRRQALEHIGHCRACADLAARLNRDLNDVGSAIGLAAVAGCIGGGTSALQRIGELLSMLRSSAAGIVDKAETGAGAALASGGAKGTGTIGAGAVAKLAGVGGGKAVLACLGAGAAATACVAAGVVPGVSLMDSDGAEGRRGATELPGKVQRVARPRAAMTSVITVAHAVESKEDARNSQSASEPPEPQPSEQVPPAEEPPPTQPAPVEEFDPVVAAAPTPAPPASAAEPNPPVGGSSSASAAQNEFGP